MAQIKVILLNGTVADANEVMANFNEIYTNITNINVASNAAIAFSKLAALPPGNILVGSAGSVTTSVAMSGDATISSTGVVSITGGGYVPIGTILPFYDYDGALTFNTSNYGYCNGQTLAFAGIGNQITPDLSGRYLAGFGTVAGGDIGTATWATAAIGANTINIEHTHAVGNHTHDMANHTHTGGTHTHDMGNHTHGPGSLYAQVAIGPSAWLYTRQTAVATWASTNSDDIGGAQTSDNNTEGTVVQGDTGTPSTNTTSGATGDTGAPSTNTTGTGSGTSGTALSTAQDIRPSSIRVRYIIRYA